MKEVRPLPFAGGLDFGVRRAPGFFGEGVGANHKVFRVVKENDARAVVRLNLEQSVAKDVEVVFFAGWAVFREREKDVCELRVGFPVCEQEFVEIVGDAFALVDGVEGERPALEEKTQFHFLTYGLIFGKSKIVAWQRSCHATGSF